MTNPLIKIVEERKKLFRDEFFSKIPDKNKLYAFSSPNSLEFFHTSSLLALLEGIEREVEKIKDMPEPDSIFALSDLHQLLDETINKLKS